jgi:radical SAM superfamily enzyme YgiQ (UPF0313 family)
MKVLLILPKKDSYTILPAPDIGIAYIARAALNAGAEVEILDAHKENIEPDKLRNFLKNKSFDLVGIKCLSIDIFKVIEYCRVIKEYNQKIITVLGGYHPTALPNEVMKSHYVDYIIKGEGELGIFYLIKNLMGHNGAIPQQEISKIPSLIYRDRNNGGKVISNPIAFEENLDNLGFPAWHLFKIEEYPQLPSSGGRFLPIITSRGCPSRCSFCCSNSIHGSKIRRRSPEHVIEEIKWMIDNFDIQRVSIFDDNFTFYKEHTLAICQLYKEKKFGINLDIPQGVRIDRIDKDVLLALEEAGCDYMGIGIESGSQDTLDIIKKGTNIYEIEEKVSLIKRETSIKLMGFFIIGFPHETETDILKTIDFALRLKLDYVAFTIFTPFPGTALFDQMLKEGYFSIDNFDWKNLLLDREAFRHRNISRDKLKKLQRKAYMKFYFRPSKISFFFRIIFKEASFISYLKRFISILKK